VETTAVESLSVARDFSTSPGPRYISEGDFSGELFRRDVLGPCVKKALDEDHMLTVDLDGTAGYGTSFLEEAFGGLIRVDGFALNELRTHIKIKSDEEPYLIEDIWNYMEDAENENK